jgi:hypothetical protein
MLCRAHHRALDAGLFTLTSDYSIVVSPLVQRADSRKFKRLSWNGKRMQIPRRASSPRTLPRWSGIKSTCFGPVSSSHPLFAGLRTPPFQPSPSEHGRQGVAIAACAWADWMRWPPSQSPPVDDEHIDRGRGCRADSRKFELLSLDGKRMQIPRREVIAPHRAASCRAGVAAERFACVSGVKGRPRRFLHLGQIPV